MNEEKLKKYIDGHLKLTEKDFYMRDKLIETKNRIIGQIGGKEPLNPINVQYIEIKKSHDMLISVLLNTLIDKDMQKLFNDLITHSNELYDIFIKFNNFSLYLDVQPSIINTKLLTILEILFKIQYIIMSDKIEEINKTHIKNNPKSMTTLIGPVFAIIAEQLKKLNGVITGNQNIKSNQTINNTSKVNVDNKEISNTDPNNVQTINTDPNKQTSKQNNEQTINKNIVAGPLNAQSITNQQNNLNATGENTYTNNQTPRMDNQTIKSNLLSEKPNETSVPSIQITAISNDRIPTTNLSLPDNNQHIDRDIEILTQIQKAYREIVETNIDALNLTSNLTPVQIDYILNNVSPIGHLFVKILVKYDHANISRMLTGILERFREIKNNGRKMGEDILKQVIVKTVKPQENSYKMENKEVQVTNAINNPHEQNAIDMKTIMLEKQKNLEVMQKKIENLTKLQTIQEEKINTQIKELMSRLQEIESYKTRLINELKTKTEIQKKLDGAQITIVKLRHDLVYTQITIIQLRKELKDTLNIITDLQKVQPDNAERLDLEKNLNSQLQTQNDKLKAYELQIIEMENLKTKVTLKQQELDAANITIDKMKLIQEELQQKLGKALANISELQIVQNNNDRNIKIKEESLTTQIKQLTLQLETTKQTGVKITDTEIQKQLKDAPTNINNLKIKLADAQENNKKLLEEISKAQQIITRLESDATQKQELIKKLELQFQAHKNNDDKYNQQKVNIETLNNQVTQLQKDLNEAVTTINDQETTITDQETTINDQETTIKEQETTINNQEKKKQNLLRQLSEVQTNTAVLEELRTRDNLLNVNRISIVQSNDVLEVNNINWDTSINTSNIYILPDLIPSSFENDDDNIYFNIPPYFIRPPSILTVKSNLGTINYKDYIKLFLRYSYILNDSKIINFLSLMKNPTIFIHTLTLFKNDATKRDEIIQFFFIDLVNIFVDGINIVNNDLVNIFVDDINIVNDSKIINALFKANNNNNNTDFKGIFIGTLINSILNKITNNKLEILFQNENLIILSIIYKQIYKQLTLIYSLFNSGSKDINGVDINEAFEKAYLKFYNENADILTFVKERPHGTTINPDNPRFSLTNTDNKLVLEYRNYPDADPSNHPFNETYNIGPVTKYYDQMYTNDRMVDDEDGVGAIKKKLETGKNVILIGNGQSGVGKTSTLINFTDDNGTQISGLVPVICNKLQNIISIVMSIKEIYTVYDSKLWDLVENKQDKITNDHSTIKNIEFKDVNDKYHPQIQFKFNNNEWIVNGSDNSETLGAIINNAFKNKKTEPTKNNDISSRSHILILLDLINKNTVTGNDINSQFVICDLAGVEDVFTCNKNELLLLDKKYGGKTLEFNSTQEKDTPIDSIKIKKEKNDTIAKLNNDIKRIYKMISRLNDDDMNKLKEKLFNDSIINNENEISFNLNINYFMRTQNNFNQEFINNMENYNTIDDFYKNNNPFDNLLIKKLSYVENFEIIDNSNTLSTINVDTENKINKLIKINVPYKPSLYTLSTLEKLVKITLPDWMKIKYTLINNKKKKN